MKIGVYTDRIEKSWTYGKSGEIFFSPLFEMFAAMHVVCNPEHHTGRPGWFERVSNIVCKELIDDIRALSDCTNAWLAPPDFVYYDTCTDLRDMDIDEALCVLDGFDIRRWKKIFELNGCDVTLSQKKKIIEVSRKFYEEYFRNEIIIIEPLMTTALRKVFREWEKEGIAKSLFSVHERLQLTENEVIFYKNKEFRYDYDDIDKIYLTGSTFLSPHLIMGYYKKELLTVKYFNNKNTQISPPKELVGLYNGLADATRLSILKSLKHMPDSTQHLAKKLKISEAAVSKQLKILSEGGLVTKTRKGNYMIYSVDEKALDFLTYRIYEFLM
ncbi:ArsR/SmtB family transcription factor [Butyrivibrio sp. LB2008]|uniref:ArsR/SmtB family transcription factor n=1 Tax=Butyrivibrio sp. LB2008 TaxID=1408305 RepID=UPI00047D9AE3|nr:metalloregulator ArsR/SmtB family transcription factor [Butyrivibrio sp. LB2008]